MNFTLKGLRILISGMQCSEECQNVKLKISVQDENTRRDWLYLTSSFSREGNVYVTTLTFLQSISASRKRKTHHISIYYIKQLYEKNRHLFQELNKPMRRKRHFQMYFNTVILWVIIPCAQLDEYQHFERI
jgi:predicted nucleic acid-binding Zn ribbon protein